MGPAYLQDVIGMDTLLHVLESICSGFPERMKIAFPHAVQLMVKRGRVGQKNGAGFYRYEKDPKGRPQKSVDPQTMQLLASVQSHPSQSFGDQELLERLMLPLVIEAAQCLEEGIAASAAEVDMALILGRHFRAKCTCIVVAHSQGACATLRAAASRPVLVPRQKCFSAC